MGELRLVEACAQGACPLCFCLAQHSREQLATLLWEQVTDLEVRRRLRASWGLCNWHTWMLLELPDSRTGTAILYEDLLRRLIERVARGTRSPRPGRLAAWFTRTRARTVRGLANVYRGRPRCPVCERVHEAEQRYLEALLSRINDPDFQVAYTRAGGLCGPHILRAVAIIRHREPLTHLLQLTLDGWSSIHQDLSSFIAKQDHRSARVFTDAEATACPRALERLTGARGLFGNDLLPRGRTGSDQDVGG